jgi:folate-dependent phosphoribosylglycinamide formyltransferase PurN
MTSFLVVTTRDLPEAHFVAASLAARGQRVGFVNLLGRPLSRRLRVLARLARRRGARYVADLCLARVLAPAAVPDGLSPFPEVTAETIAEGRRRWPRIESADPHAPEVLQFVTRFAPDWILLAGTPVLKPSLYGLAARGALNRHLGLLPHYRGSDCPIWTLAKGRPQHLGFSVHLVSEKIDGGDVLLTEHVPPVIDLTLGGYLAVLQRKASEGFVAVLDRLVDGETPAGQRQPAHGAHFPPAGYSTVRRARRTYARAVASGVGVRLERLQAA